MHPISTNVMYDFTKLFPSMKDLKDPKSYWECNVDDDNYIHVSQIGHANSELNERFSLEFLFKGNGIIDISIIDSRNGNILVTETYDNNYDDDRNSYLKKLFSDLDPRTSHSDKINGIIDRYKEKHKERK